MTEASDFISRNKTLGGRRLRDALDAARGEVIGGPGIKVNSVGGKTVVDSGGTLIAQDEATSVVWGMPGAVAKAGLCSAALPLSEIAPFIAGKLKG